MKNKNCWNLFLKEIKQLGLTLKVKSELYKNSKIKRILRNLKHYPSNYLLKKVEKMLKIKKKKLQKKTDITKIQIRNAEEHVR